MAGLLPLPMQEGWDGPSVGLPFPRRGDPCGHGSPSLLQLPIPRAGRSVLSR